VAALDLVALRHASRIKRVDSIAVTKLDVLDEMDEIKVCTHYLWGDQTIDQVPAGILPELAM